LWRLVSCPTCTENGLITFGRRGLLKHVSCGNSYVWREVLSFFGVALYTEGVYFLIGLEAFSLGTTFFSVELLVLAELKEGTFGFLTGVLIGVLISYLAMVFLSGFSSLVFLMSLDRLSMPGDFFSFLSCFAVFSIFYSLIFSFSASFI
jgi:hypothetical protein